VGAGACAAIRGIRRGETRRDVLSQSPDGQRTHGEAVEMHNTGLYNLTGPLSYPATNTGLYEITRKPADVWKFKAPTLRNIAVTAPYMHDGSVAGLG
jgi:cytochrome c peroxidase